jgi:hypothetical protein
VTSGNGRRVLAGFGGALGGLAVWRLLRRRAPRPSRPVADPADTLRAKLEEARAVTDDRDEFQAGETPVDEADPEDRRRSVHEDARARIEELRRDES